MVQRLEIIVYIHLITSLKKDISFLEKSSPYNPWEKEAFFKQKKRHECLKVRQKSNKLVLSEDVSKNI